MLCDETRGEMRLFGIGCCVELIEEGKRALSATSGRVRGWRGCYKCSPSGRARVGGTSVGSHGQWIVLWGSHDPCLGGLS